MKKLDKSKLVMNLGKRYKLVPFLDKALMNFDSPWEFKYEPKVGDTAWHPSGHCTPSVSDLYAFAKEQTDNINAVEKGFAVFAKPEVEVLKPETRKAFMVGHYWHQLLQHLCLELGFCPPSSIERCGTKIWGLKNESLTALPYHWATGSGDIAPCKLPGGWEGVVDFKTMASQQFKQPGIPQWAALKYKCQINIYMDFFDLDHGLIVTINKDTPHDFKEYEFERDQSLIDAIYGKWHFVSECIDHEVEITNDDDEHFILPCEGD